MQRLKADLHTHAAGDPVDDLAYSAEMLIDAASKLKVEVLAVAGHGGLVHTQRLAEYARRRGVVLIPAIELTLEGKHVLVLNPDETQCRVKTFDALLAVKGRGEAIIAPHPFYPTSRSLGNALVRHIELFDAIEFCALHFPGLNFNRRAKIAARRFALPLVGTTDTHSLPYGCDTFSWIMAKPTVEGIIEAIHNGRIEYVTRRVSVPQVVTSACHMVRQVACDIFGIGDKEALS